MNGSSPTPTCVILTESQNGDNRSSSDLLLPPPELLFPPEKLAPLKRLRENPDYSFFCGRLHVVLLTKFISVFAMPFYLGILAFVTHFGNATTVMFALIILGSVAATTVYGAFKGSKMCLIPFVFLQVIFIIYDVILLILLIYAAIRKDSFINFLVGTEHLPGTMPARTVLVTLCFILSVLLPPVAWSAHIVYLDFLFICELDEILAFLKEAREQEASNELQLPKPAF